MALPSNNKEKKKKYLDKLAELDEKSLEVLATIPTAKLAKLATKVGKDPNIVDLALSFFS